MKMYTVSYARRGVILHHKSCENLKLSRLQTHITWETS